LNDAHAALLGRSEMLGKFIGLPNAGLDAAETAWNAHKRSKTNLINRTGEPWLGLDICPCWHRVKHDCTNIESIGRIQMKDEKARWTKLLKFGNEIITHVNAPCTRIENFAKSRERDGRKLKEKEERRLATDAGAAADSSAREIPIAAVSGQSANQNKLLQRPLLLVLALKLHHWAGCHRACLRRKLLRMAKPR